jgi:hypothetical protein
MIVKILPMQFLMTIYNIPQYGNIYKAYRIKLTKKGFGELIQYDLVMCSIGPDNSDFIMKRFT